LSWREFIASLVHALAWPIALVIVALIFRRQVVALLEAPLKRLKAGPGGVELEYWERAAEQVSENVRVPKEAAPQLLDEEAAAWLTLADSAPGEVVLRTFQAVERELRAIADRSDIVVPTQLPTAALTDLLTTLRLITPESAKAVDGLRELRNVVAHTSDQVTHERAKEYVVLGSAVLYALRNPPAAITADR
jgi:hypothetical protein